MVKRCAQPGVVFLLIIVVSPTVARPEETQYIPGPVRILHDWLGGQCTFAPDLDVGECCAVHDMAYQAGGSSIDRWQADMAFRACIQERNRPLVAEIYFIGVRLFGWLFFNFE